MERWGGLLTSPPLPTTTTTTTISNRVNEEKKYRELKERIRMMNSQRSYAKKVSLNQECKKIGINVVIKCNEIINNSLK